MTLLRRIFVGLLTSLLISLCGVIVLFLASLRMLPTELQNTQNVMPSKHAKNLQQLSQRFETTRKNQKNELTPHYPVRITQDELNSIHFILRNQFNAHSVQVDLHHAYAQINAFYTLVTWQGKALGLTLKTQLLNSQHAFNWQETYISGWALPNQSLNIMFDWLLTYLTTKMQAEKLRGNISEINITPQALTFKYAHSVKVETIKPILKKQHKALINPAHVQRYLLSLQVIVQQHRHSDSPVTLDSLLQILFTQALFRQQKQNQRQQAIEENKAILQALALFMLPQQFKHFYPSDLHVFNFEKKPLIIRFHHRDDLAKHFIASAAIHLLLNQHASTQIGEFKELFDSQIKGGSGFSFDDIAADRAGIHFAKQATQTPISAKRVQTLFSLKGIQANDLLPNILINHTSLTEAEFITRYQSTQSPLYKQRLHKIDQVISSTLLYQQKNNNNNRH
ncbi:hypothetical protein [Algibacillus agarilyticus]|uniref:hypothetical protein n=1 Tax=Algibacillus agarilyticus TaxID=2234133 RepID=UPI000DD09FB7|nr:hypothetical protein [Algibacillus agarilyticus]